MSTQSWMLLYTMPSIQEYCCYCPFDLGYCQHDRLQPFSTIGSKLFEHSALQSFTITRVLMNGQVISAPNSSLGIQVCARKIHVTCELYYSSGNFPWESLVLVFSITVLNFVRSQELINVLTSVEI